jgi:hypothetical protein
LAVTLGAVMTGGSSSVTVTVNVLVALLPEESMAVAVTVVTPLLNTLPLAGTVVTLTVASQLSVAVGAKFTVVEQLPVASSLVLAVTLGAVMIGASSSVTVTVKVLVALLPEESHALAVTVVTPLLKTLPLAGTVMTLTAPSQLSVAVGAKVTVVEQLPVPSSLVLAVTFGAVITGASSSDTVTVNEVAALLPEESVAAAVTVVTPLLNTLPLAGTVVTFTVTSQLSVAVGAK